MKKLLFLLFLLPFQADAAISYVNSARDLNPSTGTSYNVSYTAGSNTNEGLVFTFYDNNGFITGVSYNGTAATPVQSKAMDGVTYLRMYRLENPTSGTHNITVTLSASTYVEMVVVEYAGVDQTNMEDASVSNGVTGSPPSPLNFTATIVTNNAWMVSVARNALTPIMTASTNVGAVRQSGVSAQIVVGDSNTGVSTGSQTQAWTTSGTVWSFGVMMAIKPASTIVNTTNNGCHGEFHGTIFCQQ